MKAGLWWVVLYIASVAMKKVHTYVYLGVDTLGVDGGEMLTMAAYVRLFSPQVTATLASLVETAVVSRECETPNSTAARSR